MRLGLGSYVYAWAIGIAGFPPTTLMDALGRLRRASGLRLRVVQFADNLPLHRLDAGKVERLRRYLQLAQYFDSPILHVVVDSADHRPAPNEIVATLRPLMPESDRANVTLAIENHDRFKERTLVRTLKQIDNVRVGICLDTVNPLGAGEGAEVVVETLAPYVVNLHVKDFTIQRHCHMLDFEVLSTPAGQRILDLAWLLERLKAFGRDPNAILRHGRHPMQVSRRRSAKWINGFKRVLAT